MDLNPEKRGKPRFRHESRIALEESEIGVQHDARMFSYSDFGLYFEADFQLGLETEIRIGISNSPFASVPDKYESYRGVVKWRKELKRSAYYYGYGVKFIEEDAVANLPNRDDSGRKHPRKQCNIPVKYEFENQRFEGAAKNVSVGGAFIKADERLAVGQQIILEIPLKKKGKMARLTGSVAWSNQDGFGVKFLRSK
jgi:hypothetical protein